MTRFHPALLPAAGLLGALTLCSTGVVAGQSTTTDYLFGPADPALPSFMLAANGNQKQQPQQKVGKAPPRKKAAPPKVQAVADVGGVLTPRGNLTIEPSVSYSNSQVNTLTFRGVKILDTFLIGILNAEDVDRNVLSASIAARYGITNRLEAEVRVPYTTRDDSFSATIPNTSDPNDKVQRDLSGDGLGDVEVALHYQINRGLGGWPFFIGNLRYKSNTGTGPFDVARDAEGIETELPTGSGFHAIEPSVTILYPTDPAVLFGNIGYLVNLEEDINKTIGGAFVGKVDPGDTFRLSFGMAYAVNSRVSISTGYKHDFIFKTKVDGKSDSSANTLQVGALSLGYNYQVNNRVSTNLSVEIGATADAPDVVMSLRVPISAYTR